MNDALVETVENIHKALRREQTGHHAPILTHPFEDVEIGGYAGVIPGPFRKEYVASIKARTAYWISSELPDSAAEHVHRRAAEELMMFFYRDILSLADKARYQLMQGNLKEVKDLLSAILDFREMS